MREACMLQATRKKRSMSRRKVAKVKGEAQSAVTRHRGKFGASVGPRGTKGCKSGPAAYTTRHRSILQSTHSTQHPMDAAKLAKMEAAARAAAAESATDKARANQAESGTDKAKASGSRSILSRFSLSGRIKAPPPQKIKTTIPAGKPLRTHELASGDACAVGACTVDK